MVPHNLDLHKLGQNIHQKGLIGTGAPYGVIVLSGALSPVHNSHIENFKVAKRHLEACGKCTVVAGFLCPSSDYYVKTKLGKDAIRLQTRNELGKIALADSELCDWGWVSAPKICRTIHDILKRDFSNHQFQVWLVAGADHALRHQLPFHDFIVCVGRKGESEELTRFLEDHKKSISPKFLLANAEEETDTSSTQIRKILRTEPVQWHALSTLLHPNVVVELQKLHEIGKIFEG